jgi:hypothetical protein
MVEPGGTTGLSQRLERQVGTHSQRDALSTCSILKPAQLDDFAGRGVARCIEIGQSDMVGTAIDTIDHRVDGAVELIVEALRDETADDRSRGVRAINHEVAHTPFDTLLG